MSERSGFERGPIKEDGSATDQQAATEESPEGFLGRSGYPEHEVVRRQPGISPYRERAAMREQRESERGENSGSVPPRYACTAEPEGFFDRFLQGKIYKINALLTALQTLSGPEVGQKEVFVEPLIHQAASQLENDQRFREEFGEEALGFIASELRMIPTADLIKVVAKKSGMSSMDVSRENKFSELVFYSNTSFESVAHFNDEHSTPPLPGALWRPPSRSDAEYANSASGLAHGREQMFLNLSHLTRFDPNSSLSHEEQIRRYTRDVFYHEFLHLFGAPTPSSEADRLLYEGVTDAMSLEVRRALGENIDPSIETFSAGYHYGPTLTGDILLHLEDPNAVEEIYASYVSQDWSGIQAVIQEQFGQPASQEATRTVPIIVSSSDVSFERQAQTINEAIGAYLPLEEILSAMTPSARTRAIEDLNTRSSLRLAYVGGGDEDVSWQGVHFFYPDGAEKRFVVLHGTEDRRSFSLIDYPKQVNDSHSTTGSLPVVVSLYPKGFVGGGEIYPGSRNPWE